MFINNRNAYTQSFHYVFLVKSIPLASRGMDAETKFGSAQGCAVRTGALKRDLFGKIKKRFGTALFGYFFLLLRKSDSPRGETSAK